MDETSSCGLPSPIGAPHHPPSSPQMNGLAASQSTLAPNKRLEVHLSHRLLLLQVNSLVTDRVLLQRSLEQLRGELDEERRRREEAEERAARLGREVRDSRFRIHSAVFSR